VNVFLFLRLSLCWTSHSFRDWLLVVFIGCMSLVAHLTEQLWRISW
jgi:hypothetical protein